MAMPFIALRRRESGRSRREHLEEVRQQHHAARHVCYAWQFGPDRHRAADDGEPGGSAGAPIHGVLRAHDLHWSLIAVVRYFGGVKLGVGGLIEAYREAGREAVANAGLDTNILKTPMTFGYTPDLTRHVMQASSNTAPTSGRTLRHPLFVGHGHSRWRGRALAQALLRIQVPNDSPQPTSSSDMTRFLPRFFALLLCGLAASPAQAQLEFEHDGLTRTYFMDAPDPIPAGAPIVLVLHGYTSSAQLIRAYSGWVPLALEEGFVAVFPQGMEDNFNINHWNANIGNSNTDDHGFLVALVQHLQQEHGLSADCVYSCGMSNGGFMSYSLACEHPEVFSAIGSVTGAMSGADFGCTPSEVVPIVHLHGTADQTVAYDGGVGTPGWGGEGVPAIIDHWTGLGHHDPEEPPCPTWRPTT